MVWSEEVNQLFSVNEQKMKSNKRPQGQACLTYILGNAFLRYLKSACQGVAGNANGMALRDFCHRGEQRL